MLRVAMVQMNPTVGDLKNNVKKVGRFIEQAKSSKAHMVVFPELCVTGYPPQDLLYESAFVKENKRILFEAMGNVSDVVVVVGFVDHEEGLLRNSAAVFKDGAHLKTIHKTLLPTYDVFDEARYFEPQRRDKIQPVEVNLDGRRVKLGVEICEDLWDEKYRVKVTDILCRNGADLIVNISASPFYVGKRFERIELLKKKSAKNHTPILYTNMVGGQDELVFDGQSIAVDCAGKVVAFGPQFEEALVYVDIDLRTKTAAEVELPNYDKEEEMFNALVLGVRDYFHKTGFEKAIVGMSGGIDSSLTACIATAALGKDNVIGVSMPSKYSSEHSKTDAQLLARNLGIFFVQFPIQDVVESYRSTLSAPLKTIREHFGVSEEDDDPVADENIQPRVRGNSLMDISNRLSRLRILVLNTGNKTELALGYCTLYGDMTGGLGVLGDVSKLEVYKLAEYINRKAKREIIPVNVFRKKPSPELKEGQFDPFNFDVVCPLVDEIIENRRGKQELMEMGYPKEIVDDVYRRIRNSEYKRWQAPPCIKITRKAFGIGWKMPIVNKYDG
ncbi:MAG: NAD+ synthase [Nitrososphaeria archaeon]